MRSLAWILAAAALLAASAASGGDPAPAAEGTVPAKRYRTWVVESGFEASHGGGQWLDELFFPEPKTPGKGIVANVVWTTDYAASTWTSTPRLNVFDGSIRNRFRRHLQDEKDTETPVEDVRVPAALAAEVFAAAELHRRLEAARKDLGTRLGAAGLVREWTTDAAGAPVPKPVEPVKPSK